MGKHLHIELEEDDRSELEQLIHSGNAPAQTHCEIGNIGSALDTMTK